MTQHAAKVPILQPGAFEHYARAKLHAAAEALRRTLSTSPKTTLNPENPANIVLRTILFRGPLVLGALFLLVAGIWFALDVKGYTPVAPDDLRIQVYTNELLKNPGALIPGSIMLDRQLPLLQYFTYVSVVGLFGWDFPIVLIPLIFSVALTIVVGYGAYKATGEPWAAVIAAFAIASLPLFALQARTLQFYPAVLFFGYGGLIAALIYIRNGSKWAQMGAIAGLVGALYSYNIGILFLPIPLLYLLVHRNREIMTRMVQIYSFVVVLAIPFFIWHMAIGGTDGFFSQETGWIAQEGHLLIRNLEFWGYGSASSSDFIGKLPGMLEDAAGFLIFPLLGLGILGLMRLPGWQWKAVILIALAIPVGALVYTSPAALPRYVYILLPALVILAVYGLAGVVQFMRPRRWALALAPPAGIVILAFLGLAIVDNGRAEAVEASSSVTSAAQHELAEMAERIDDDKAVFGTRAWAFAPYLHSNLLLGQRAITEDDFIAFLSWSSEGTVARVFQTNDVGWVLLRKPARVWEVNYHVWLREVNGKLPRHHLRLERSNLVKPAYNGRHYVLYKVRQAAL